MISHLNANGLGFVRLNYQFHERMFLFSVPLYSGCTLILPGEVATYEHPGPTAELLPRGSRVGPGPTVHVGAHWVIVKSSQC